MSRRSESHAAAAARRSYEVLMIEREARRKARLAESGLGAARKLSVSGSEPGAFTARACVIDRYDHDLGMTVGPDALRPLPRAVLVHLGHDLANRAVAVAVPTFDDGAIYVDCVFARTARNAWGLVQNGELRSTSIYARLEEFYRGESGRLVKGVLVAVDLVRSGADKKANLTKLVAAAELTPAQREVQERLERYLTDPTRPRGVDLFACAESRGAAAMQPLHPVVAPLLGGSFDTAPVRQAPARPLARSTSERRCAAMLDGVRCDHPPGHGTWHWAEARSMGWDDRARSDGGAAQRRLRTSLAWA